MAEWIISNSVYGDDFLSNDEYYVLHTSCKDKEFRGEVEKVFYGTGRIKSFVCSDCKLKPLKEILTQAKLLDSWYSTPRL